MDPDTRPAVEGAEPPEWLSGIVNPIMRALLRSPLHRLISKQLLLLTMRGRKTGKEYTVVVGRHDVNGGLVVVAGGRWRYNLRGGAPVEVTLEGRSWRGRGYLVEDRREVVRIYQMLFDRVGIKSARRLGLRVNVDRRPTDEELEAALADRGAVHIELAGGAARHGSGGS